MSNTRDDIERAKRALDSHLRASGWLINKDNALTGDCIICRGGDKQDRVTGWYSIEGGVYYCHRATCDANSKILATDLCDRMAISYRDYTPEQSSAVEQSTTDASDSERSGAFALFVRRWERAPRASGAVPLHPYLTRKKITSIRADVKVLDGELLIPYYRQTGDTQHAVAVAAILRIFAEPDSEGKDRKLAYGSKPSGAFIPLRGAINDGRPPATTIIITEGLATAYAITASTMTCDPQPAVISAGAQGNLPNIANLYRSIFADAKIIIAGDNDGKEATDTARAKSAGYFFTAPTEPKTDYWDVWSKHGSEAVLSSIDAAEFVPQIILGSKYNSAQMRWHSDRYERIASHNWLADRQQYITDWKAAEAAEAPSDKPIILAHLFAGQFGDYVRCTTDPDKPRWLIHTDTAWQVIHKSAITSLVLRLPVVSTRRDKISNELFPDIGPTPDRLGGGIVRALPSMASLADDEIDKPERVKNLLNLQNGTLELDTLTLREHRPADFITRTAPCIWNGDETPTAYLKFLGDFTGRDSDKAAEIERMLGACLAGGVKYHVFILYGEGGNGKTTLIRLIDAVLGKVQAGGYSAAMDAEALIPQHKRGGASHNEPVAKTQGARAIIVSEPAEKGTLNSPVLKQLTGDDTMSASRKYGAEKEWESQGQVIIATNHRPRQTDFSYAMRRRLRFVECTLSLAEADMDRGLFDAMLLERGAILRRWAKEAHAFLRDGYINSAAIDDSTKENEARADLVGETLRRILDDEPAGKIKISDVHEKFYTELVDNGDYSAEDDARKKIQIRTIGDAMERLGYTKKRNSVDRKRYYCGCKWLP